MTKINNKLLSLILLSYLITNNKNIFGMHGHNFHRGFSDSSEERERKRDRDRRRRGPRMFWSPSLDTSSDEEDNTGYKTRPVRPLFARPLIRPSVKNTAPIKVKVTEPIGKIGEWDFSVTKIKTRSGY